MGFYGNITNTGKTHFQFDKIFNNRREMDLSCLNGTDGIFVGRFVLVAYDTESDFSSGGILSGFLGENNIIYADIDNTHPYIYTEFTRVSSPIENNWNKYYWKQGDYYYKLPSSDYYNAEEAEAGNYWIPTVADETLSDFLVTQKSLVRLFDQTGRYLTENLYACNGNTQGQPATWEKILDNANYSQYLINYNIDKQFYNLDMDVRGYDATVWQKIYSEGKGRFILIARLNGQMPGLELFADTPKLYPASPYIDTKSSDTLYRIHVPTKWGFRIKEVMMDPITEELIGNSDQKIRQAYTTFNTNNEIISTGTREINADIYFNKKGFAKAERTRDNTSTNEILINPSGSSGKYYYDNDINTMVQGTDTYELSVHLPVLGNTISDFFDVFYSEDRKLDINWYNAEDGNKNSTELKTFSLDTVAGNINTFHDRLGQIIQPLSEYPSLEQIEGLSTEVIYSITNDEEEVFYYYKDIDYDYTPIADSDIFFDSGTTLTIELYEPNTYYVKLRSDNSFIIADKPLSYYNNNYTTFVCNSSNQPLFYKKNISTARYVPIALQQFRPIYYYKENNNYILDESPADAGPLHPDFPYYNITNANRLNQQPKHFSDNEVYRPNLYYYKAENNLDYVLSTADIPDPLIDTFYLIDTPQVIGSGYEIMYQPEVYYYYDSNGKLRFDNGGDGYKPERRPYYYIPYDTSQLIQVYDSETDKIISGYALDLDHKIAITNFIDPAQYNNQDIYVQDNDGNYIHLSNVTDYSVARIYYILTNALTPITEFFLPNKYYAYKTLTGQQKGYFLASTWESSTTDYYQLINLSPMTIPFYQGDKYWYQEENNLYTIDHDSMMTHSSYFTETGIYVYEDFSERFTRGYKWRDQALFVPASVTLATRTIKNSLFQIQNIDNGQGSLNGAILHAAQLNASADNDNREKHTMTGSINLVNDALNTLSHTYPQRLLYVNDFGQITSTDITLTQLKNLMNRVTALEQRVATLES